MSDLSSSSSSSSSNGIYLKKLALSPTNHLRIKINDIKCILFKRLNIKIKKCNTLPCYKCNNENHIYRDCPQAEYEYFYIFHSDDCALLKNRKSNNNNSKISNNLQYILESPEFINTVFSTFIQENPIWEGMKVYSIINDQEKPDISFDWSESTEGLGLELKKYMHVIRNNKITDKKQDADKIISKGGERIYNLFVSNKQQLTFSHQATALGHLKTKFVDTLDIYEENTCEDDQEYNLFAIEILQAFVKKYPVINNIQLFYKQGEVWADWSKNVIQDNNIEQ